MSLGIEDRDLLGDIAAQLEKIADALKRLVELAEQEAERE